MPRRRRSFFPGACYHVINRGNNRSTLFHRPADYRAFVDLIRGAQKRTRLELFAACVMPNHFHLVVRFTRRDDLSRWMHWLLTTHSHRHHLEHGSSGRVWQGPYKAFPIEGDLHLLTVMRYVERNAARAGLVQQARAWPWGSAAWRHGPARRAALIDAPPVALPAAWDDVLDATQTVEELAALRTSVNRQHPFGSDGWKRAAPECRGFDPEPRPPGRPAQKAVSEKRCEKR